LCLLEGENTQVIKQNLLECGHAICPEHLRQFRDPRCPICRKPLKGRLVTPDITRQVEARKKRQKELESLANQMVARAIETNPRFDTNEQARTRLYDLIYQRMIREGEELSVTADAILAFEMEDNPLLQNQARRNMRYVDILLNLVLQ
jgi:hypothetical protein